MLTLLQVVLLHYYLHSGERGLLDKYKQYLYYVMASDFIIACGLLYLFGKKSTDDTKVEHSKEELKEIEENYRKMQIKQKQLEIMQQNKDEHEIFNKKSDEKNIEKSDDTKKKEIKSEDKKHKSESSEKKSNHSKSSKKSKEKNTQKSNEDVDIPTYNDD